MNISFAKLEDPMKVLTFTFRDDVYVVADDSLKNNDDSLEKMLSQVNGLCNFCAQNH